MATALSKHKNPINIAPLVDVLLILFVILVVAARFDNGEETKQLKVELNNTKTAVEASKDAAKLKELLGKLNDLELENGKLKQKVKTEAILNKEVKSVGIAKPEKLDVKDKAENIETLKSNIQQLRKELRQALSGNLQVKIEVYDDGSIYMNERKTSMQDLKTVFSTVYPNKYNLSFEATPNATAIKNSIESYLHSIGFHKLEV